MAICFPGIASKVNRARLQQCGPRPGDDDKLHDHDYDKNDEPDHRITRGHERAEHLDDLARIS